MFASSSRKTAEMPVPGSSISTISADTVVTGNITSKGDIRVDGTLKGHLTCDSKILIGPQGSVEGNISGQNADIMGNVKGNVRMRGQLNLLGKAVITGDLHVSKLQMESTVCFNGNCHMGANVVELNNENAAAVNE